MLLKCNYKEPKLRVDGKKENNRSYIVYVNECSVSRE